MELKKQKRVFVDKDYNVGCQQPSGLCEIGFSSLENPVFLAEQEKLRCPKNTVLSSSGWISF